MLLRGKLLAGALFAGALFGPTEAVIEPPATGFASGGGGGYMRSIDFDLMEQIERISRESEQNARRLPVPGKQAKPAKLVEAVSKALPTARREDLAEQIAAQSAALKQAVAGLQESQRLAKQAIEKAKADSINDFNALMMALVLLDEE